MVPIVLLLVLCIYCVIAFQEQDEPSAFWQIRNQTGVANGQSLRFRKVLHPINTFHSCYEITCDGPECAGPESVIQVCYPAVVISGLPKCGTSAMYGLLSKFPGATTLREKENCPYDKYPNLWDYFLSLPRISDIKEHSITIDGCIFTPYNIKIRELLRNPQTYYIEMIRDYADMLWSAYNFWCTRQHDGPSCDTVTPWAVPGIHKRTPELFHHIVQSRKNHFEGAPWWIPMQLPCSDGKYYFSSVYKQLQSNRQHNHTIIVANEELDLYPLQVAQRVARVIGYNIDGMDLSVFEKVRINTQDNKGTNSVTSKENYMPGVYNISNYQPLSPKTRTLINKCWHEDCIALSKIPPYYKYTACHSERVGGLTIADIAQHDKRLLDL